MEQQSKDSVPCSQRLFHANATCCYLDYNIWMVNSVCVDCKYSLQWMVGRWGGEIVFYFLLLYVVSQIRLAVVWHKPNIAYSLIRWQWHNSFAVALVSTSAFGPTKTKGKIAKNRTHTAHANINIIAKNMSERIIMDNEFIVVPSIVFETCVSHKSFATCNETISNSKWLDWWYNQSHDTIMKATKRRTTTTTTKNLIEIHIKATRILC